MTKTKLEKQIGKMSQRLAEKRAHLHLLNQADRRKQAMRDRKARDAHMYKLGGMVDKMGLSALEETLFLGLLALIHDSVEKMKLSEDGPKRLSDLAARGAGFLPVGKKLDQISYSRPRPNLMQQEQRTAASLDAVRN